MNEHIWPDIVVFTAWVVIVAFGVLAFVALSAETLGAVIPELARMWMAVRSALT